MFLFAFVQAKASAQQTSVDIIVSPPVFANGAVQARVDRKYAGGKLAPQVMVRVSIAVKGQKPFYSTDVGLKEGGSATVSAPFKSVGNEAFTANAYALDMKEMSDANNTAESAPRAVAVMPMSIPV